jgi:hypothetical protein
MIGLDRKKTYFNQVSSEIKSLPEANQDPMTNPLWRLPSILNPFDGRMEDFELGTFHNMDSVFIRWVDGEWFQYCPSQETPFSFERHNGEVVTPGVMNTDGGSIPRIFWWITGLSPWDYGPAYLIHDWEFDLHHANETNKTFDEVNRTMMEALRTLMDAGYAETNAWAFSRIWDGINSDWAKRVWNGRP